MEFGISQAEPRDKVRPPDEKMERELIDFGKGGKAFLFKLNSDEWFCPVCGFGSLDKPYFSDGGASFDKCPGCRIEFGFDDDAHRPTTEPRGEVWQELRKEWLGYVKNTKAAKDQLLNIGVVIDEAGNQLSDPNCPPPGTP